MAVVCSDVAPIDRKVSDHSVSIPETSDGIRKVFPGDVDTVLDF